ncbi:MAG: glycine--tRNA ligase subunit beta, partial [Alphaproteobacteria bacterium]
MPELLLELLSEEIPARMQAGAAVQLERLVVDALKEEGLEAKDAKAFVTPRRLALFIRDLPVKTADVRDERKGPRVGAPEAAIQGFLRSTGLASTADLKTKNDGKGEFYVAVIETPGRATVNVLAEIIPAIVANFHWPKSMRWGASTMRWVRPLHNVLCIFGGKVVPLAIDTGDGILRANHNTYGHRFLAPQQLHITSFEDYWEQLLRAHVVLDGAERKEIIMRDLTRLAAAEGLEPIEDVGLLEEVAGLVEDPVVLIGKIDKEFLDVPPEVLSTAMRAHQKYFSLRDAKTKKFAPRFGVVANLRAKDGGKGIIAGNERVLRARLSDARFFWDQDRKRTLESRVRDLEGIVYQDWPVSLRTIYDKVTRIRSTISTDLLVRALNYNYDLAEQAAVLCKADLT